MPWRWSPRSRRAAGRERCSPGWTAWPRRCTPTALRHDATILQLQGARVSVTRGDLEDARSRLRRVRVDSASPVTTRLLWREVRAELARARGDGRHAREHVRAGLSDLHAWQSSFGSLDLQSTLVGHGRDLASQGLELAVEHGNPDLLYEWSERARTLVGRVSPVRPPADEQVAHDLSELRVLQGEQPAARTPEARRVEELRSARTPAPVVRRGGRRGLRAGRPRGAARRARAGRCRAGGARRGAGPGHGTGLHVRREPPSSTSVRSARCGTGSTG